MIPGVPLEIRLQIWEAVLRQPRVVHIHMRPLQPLHGNSAPVQYTAHSSTPIPVLLHLCAETRALALAAHYTLSIGRHARVKWRPVLWLGDAVKSSTGGDEGEESEESESCRPRVYLNWKWDTVVFRVGHGGQWEEHKQRMALQNMGIGTARVCFPFGAHLDAQLLSGLESLALSINLPGPGDAQGLGSRQRLFMYLDVHIEHGYFPRLRKLSLCLDADDLDPSKGQIELVDLAARGANGEEVNENEDMARALAKRWQAEFSLEAVASGSGSQLLRANSREGLKHWKWLRNVLLKNGASEDKLLSFVLVRNVAEGRGSSLSVR